METGDLEDADDDLPKTARKGIQSVEIGLSVLDALVELGGPASLSAVSQRCGLSTPQTHRYLASLVNAGMAQQNPGTGHYGLGPSAVRLGLGALAQTDLFRIADQELSAFCRESNRTVLLAALGPSGPTVVRWHFGFPPVVTSLTVGSILPLLRSATGHVFLAFVPERETEPLVVREQSTLGLRPVDVEAVKARVRATGFGRIDGALIPGLRAIALPIFDIQGRAVLVVTLLANDSYEESGDEAIRLRLESVCRQISAAIGGSGPQR